MEKAVRFLEGRRQRETVFVELKSQGALGCVPCRRRAANQCHMAVRNYLAAAGNL